MVPWYYDIARTGSGAYEGVSPDSCDRQDQNEDTDLDCEYYKQLPNQESVPFGKQEPESNGTVAFPSARRLRLAWPSVVLRIRPVGDWY